MKATPRHRPIHFLTITSLLAVGAATALPARSEPSQLAEVEGEAPPAEPVVSGAAETAGPAGGDAVAEPMVEPAGGADASQVEPDVAPVDAAAASAPTAVPADANAPGAGQPATAAAPAAPAPAAPAASATDANKGTPAIADGSRITLRDGEFSIQPPPGWEVYTDHPSLTLLMQVPFKPDMKYQRTIQVASFAGPRFVDEVTAKEYEDVIVRKFSAASGGMVDYKVRNHLNTNLADGREALLFYTEFGLDGVNLMQAHILVSGKQRHYLLSFTDVAEHFESDAATRFLTEAWDSMTSVQLGGPSPARFESMAVILVGAGTFALLLIVAFAFRQWHAARAYRDFADDRDLGDGDLASEPPRSLATSDYSTTGLGRDDLKPSRHSQAEFRLKEAEAESHHGSQAPGSALPSRFSDHIGSRSAKRPSKAVTDHSSAARSLGHDDDDLA